MQNVFWYMFSWLPAFVTIPKLEPRCAVVQAFPWGRLTVEAAPRFPSILMGGSLIPIVVYWDGDGFSLAKHIRILQIVLPGRFFFIRAL